MWTPLMDAPQASAINLNPPHAGANAHVMFLVRRSDEVVWLLEQIAATLDALGYSTHDANGVRLALEEAIVNGLRHGNKSDPGKCVRIQCQMRADELTFAVQDEGAGFAAGEVPEPTLAENWTRPSGRGLLLMRHFMTTVQFSDGGRRVTMSKLRNP